MLYREYRKLEENEIATCARCGSGLRVHAIFTTTGEALGVDCAGTLGVSPQTVKQRRALPARQARVLAAAELAGAVAYRDECLAALGLPVEALGDLLRLPSEGGSAHNGTFLRRCVDHFLNQQTKS